MAGDVEWLEREAARSESAPGELTVKQILAWADAYYAAHGAWPEGRIESSSGAVTGAPGESWTAINQALALGLRGLPGDSSLAELLAEQRGAPVPDLGPKALADKIWAWEQEQFPIKGPRQRQRASGSPPGEAVRPPLLTVEQILVWADDHHARTAKWPSARSGAVLAAPREKWCNLNSLLEKGQRGLPGGVSLSGLLAEYRGGGNHPDRQPLSITAILDWADAHHAASGKWPSLQSGTVSEAPFPLTWAQVDYALRYGGRGLPGDSSLARLWEERRGHAKYRRTEDLTVEQILAWADAYHAARGRWPTKRACALEAAPGVTWKAINHALREGYRGMPGGSSLAGFLAEHRGHRNTADLPRLTIEQVLAWADVYHAAHGTWPSSNAGPIAAAPGETWMGVDLALGKGHRGLPGGTSLASLLDAQRPRRPRLLTVAMIEEWAVSHLRATGSWPNICSGPVRDLPDETWKRVDRSLRDGNRGLPGGDSLPLLIGRLHAQHPSAAPPLSASRPKLTIAQILAWADVHHAAEGVWPRPWSGRILGAPGENWSAVNQCLRAGFRGLPKGSSLERLLEQHRAGPRGARR
jgi:hypothetical protein